jgi:hypothetical protein
MSDYHMGPWLDIDPLGLLNNRRSPSKMQYIFYLMEGAENLEESMEGKMVEKMVEKKAGKRVERMGGKTVENTVEKTVEKTAENMEG